MSRVAIPYAVLVVFCAGCETAAPSPGTPILTGGDCHPFYIDDIAKAGFSPPGGWIGPIDNSYNFEWKPSPDSITSTHFSVTGTQSPDIESLGHYQAQILAIIRPILVSERTTTLSGQDAWLIVSGSNGLVSVSVYMWNNFISYHVTATGYDLEGTDDVFALTSLAKTLCLQ